MVLRLLARGETGGLLRVRRVADCWRASALYQRRLRVSCGQFRPGFGQVLVEVGVWEVQVLNRATL